MTVGIISYLSDRGLGNMAHDLRQQLGITRQLVVPDIGWPIRMDWANGEEFYLNEWAVSKEDLQMWKETDGVDTIVTIETPFGDNTFWNAKQLGMRTILIPMWEAFNPYLPAYQHVDLYVCPSFKAFQEVPFDNKCYIPYPVDTENEFKFKERSGPAKVFVHNAGSGGMNGRKGTRETIEAFIKAAVPGTQLLVRCQRPLQEICGIDGVSLPSNIKVDYGSKKTRAELYDVGDVLIAAHHYDGHSLVTLEGMACGMPVITTDAAPMNEYWGYRLNTELLVKVQEQKFLRLVNPHCLAMVPSVEDLAEKIRWCSSHDMFQMSRENREIAEREHSWTVRRPQWKKALGA